MSLLVIKIWSGTHICLTFKMAIGVSACHSECLALSFSSIPDSNFLFMCTLRGRSGGSDIWVPVIGRPRQNSLLLVLANCDLGLGLLRE